MKAAIQRFFNIFGLEISRRKETDYEFRPSLAPDTPIDPYSKIKLMSVKDIVDLESLAEISRTLPGMITPQSGQFLYSLCYMQRKKGDVVEIGSWQGRSTSFLARAVSNSRNGRFYAIDHFAGTPGEAKSSFRVTRDDLSDLENNFHSNMKRVGLSDCVTLLNMSNEKAVARLSDAQIRFLFIDGDHSKEGVAKDIELFFPKLSKGSIVVFDDFRPHAKGVIEAIDERLAEHKVSRIMSYHGTLVIQI
ncbi:MAG: class I SAM-dependent methyltransferase [Elusimicrobiota bacterium]